MFTKRTFILLCFYETILTEGCTAETMKETTPTIFKSILDILSPELLT